MEEINNNKNFLIRLKKIISSLFMIIPFLGISLSLFQYIIKFKYYNISFEFFQYETKDLVFKVSIETILNLFMIAYMKLINTKFKVFEQNKFLLIFLYIYMYTNSFIIIKLLLEDILNFLNIYQKQLDVVEKFLKDIFDYVNEIGYLKFYLIYFIIFLIFNMILCIKDDVENINEKKLNIKEKIILFFKNIFFKIYIFNWCLLFILLSIRFDIKFNNIYNKKVKLDYTILKQEQKEDKIILFKVGDKIFVADFDIDDKGTKDEKDDICTIYTKEYEIRKYENIKVENRVFSDVIVDKEHTKEEAKEQVIKTKTKTSTEITEQTTK